MRLPRSRVRCAYRVFPVSIPVNAMRRCGSSATPRASTETRSQSMAGATGWIPRCAAVLNPNASSREWEGIYRSRKSTARSNSCTGSHRDAAAGVRSWKNREAVMCLQQVRRRPPSVHELIRGRPTSSKVCLRSNNDVLRQTAHSKGSCPPT